MGYRLNDLRQSLRAKATPQKAAASAWFFKTGPGQYAETDKFLGVSVPEQRALAKAHKALPLPDIDMLLTSEWHEDRLTALFIMVIQYKNGTKPEQKNLYELYMKHVGPMAYRLAAGKPYRPSPGSGALTWGVNNWDLVDGSAYHIVGPWLDGSSQKTHVLTSLATAESLWERRVAMVSTYHYIKQGRVDETYLIADILRADPQDLIQKAVGWMLRETGKRCGRDALKAFLAPRYRTMPRTMLRYAIEHFPPQERAGYLV